MSQSTQHRLHFWGWILFVGSAVFFMASSIRAGDPLSLIGGVLFLVACFVFLAPLIAQLEQGEDASNLSPPSKCFRYLSGWFRAANWQWRVPGAPTRLPAPAHLQDQIRRHSIRSELRFFASTR